jgi:hypothetical protein
MKIKARVLKRCEFSVTCHDVEQDSAVRYLHVGTAALSDSVTSDGSNLWVIRSGSRESLQDQRLAVLLRAGPLFPAQRTVASFRLLDAHVLV